MGSQRVKHDWVTELNWTECIQDGKTENFSYSISPSLLPVQSSFLPHFLLSFQQSCVLSSPTHCLPPILLYTLYSFRHWPFFLILFFPFSCCCSVIQWCMTLCNSMDCSIPGFPVLLEFAQTHVHWVDDAIQLSHPLSPLFLLRLIFPSIRVFSNELALHSRWPNVNEEIRKKLVEKWIINSNKLDKHVTLLKKQEEKN